jgi:hypothetical protein
MILGAFKDLNELNFFLTVVPIIATKSTCIWCPMLEMVFNSSVRRNLLFIKITKSDRILQTSENNRLLSSWDTKRISNSSFKNAASQLTLNESKVAQFYDMDLHHDNNKNIDVNP